MTAKKKHKNRQRARNTMNIFISELDKVYQPNRAATNSTSLYSRQIITSTLHHD